MTTIAYRDGVLAADSLATWHSTRDGYVTKIAKRGDVLCAISGSISYGQRFMDWFTTGCEGYPPSAGQEDGAFAHGYLITPDDWICMWGPRGWERVRFDLFAAGSGGEFAEGAMRAGAAPEEAVAIAIQCDTQSGGPVQVLRRRAPVR